MKRFFLFSILTLYLFSSCIERDMELTYLDSNGVTDGYDDDHDHHDDDDDDDDDDHHHHDDDDDDDDHHHDDDHHDDSGKSLGKWKGDFTVKSPCNTIGEYEMELKFKTYDKATGKVTGKLEIENKWLAKDYVEFYFDGEITENNSKLIIRTFKIKKQNIRSCNWCEVNTFSFVMEPSVDGLRGKWESAGCTDNGFNKENNILLKRRK